MKRIIRNRRLTPEEAAKYKAIREQAAEELPDLIARHHERMVTVDQRQELLPATERRTRSAVEASDRPQRGC